MLPYFFFQTTHDNIKRNGMNSVWTIEECNNAYANESSLSTQRVCYQASAGKVQVTSLMQYFFFNIFLNCVSTKKKQT